jgi:hypothetical protein
MRRLGLIPCVLVVFVILAAACSRTPGAHSIDAPQGVDSSAEHVCTPVRVVILQDKTGSATWTGTPFLQVGDLEPLFELLSYCGGELGLWLISDDSNRGLLRLNIDKPPIEPVEPPKEGNPYKVAEKYAAYRREANNFSNKLAVWEKESERRVAMFNADAELILKRSASARKTDVWGAIRRADLFLSESASAWGQEPLCYAVLITDGKDNVRREKVRALGSAAKLLMVNASGSVGALEALNPLRFESIQSAARFIAAEVEVRN